KTSRLRSSRPGTTGPQLMWSARSAISGSFRLRPDPGRRACRVNPPIREGPDATPYLVADLAAAFGAGALRQLCHRGPEAGAAQPLGPERIAAVKESTRPAAWVDGPHTGVP